MCVSMPNTVPELIHVAVGVLVRDGRVLVAQRAEHLHQGGLWEFPGGKLEPGESVQNALLARVGRGTGSAGTERRGYAPSPP